MEISCQNCDNTYTIDYNILLPSGKKVRCKNCSHTWVQLPNLNDSILKIESYPDSEIQNVIQSKISHSTETIKNESRYIQPIIKKETHDLKNQHTSSESKTYKNKGIYINFITSIIFIFLTLLIGFQDITPNSIKKFCRKLGLNNTRHISLINPEIIYLEKNHSMNIIMKGSIRNLSQREKFLPKVYAVFYNKNKKKILSQKILDKIIILKHEEDYSFEVVLNDLPDSTDVIAMRIGNFFDTNLY